MKQSTKGGLIFILVIITSFIIGSYILTATFFGVLTLLGLIVLIESIRPLKWLVSKSSRIVDVIIFLFTILAMAQYGLNISAGLTVAGLGYTLAYAPYLREQAEDLSLNFYIFEYTNKDFVKEILKDASLLVSEKVYLKNLRKWKKEISEIM